RPSGRATPSLRDAPGDAPIQIDAVPKLIVAPQPTAFRECSRYLAYHPRSVRRSTASEKWCPMPGHLNLINSNAC
ncbi:hypothetical protein CN068_31180, partial [Sinorhizobium meliloti]